MGKPNKAMIERLTSQMDKVGINARELAERANVGRSFVYDIISGKSNNPTSKKLAAISEVLGTNVPYLLYGTKEGKEIFPKSANDSNSVATIASLNVENTASGNTLVNEDKEAKPYYFQRSWIKNTLKSKPSDLRIVTVQGDSMEPTLSNDDIVLIDKTKTKPTNPGIFALFDGNNLEIRRVEYVQDSKTRIRITCDNHKHPFYKCNMDEVEVLGRVVWYARKL